MTFGSIDKRDESLSIKEVQRYLRVLSNFGTIDIPNLIIDGVYGNRTRDAVRTFQRDTGIPVTGVVDLVTWEILYEEYLIATEKSGMSEGINPFEENKLLDTISPGDKSNIVYILQAILETLSIVFDFEDQDITGEYDDVTKRNVIRFQEASGLPVTGDVDKITWNALARIYNGQVNKQ